MKKYNFNFDLTGLSTYTDEVGGELIAKAVLKGKTAEYVKVAPGIKGSQSLNLLDSSLTVQDGTCGWNADGSTTLSQRDITVCDYKVNEALCPKDLNDYWAGQLLTPGSYNETVPFEEQIAELKVSQISQYIEDKVWGASTGAGDCFDGFKSLISTGTAGVVEATGSVAITPTNALEQVDLLISFLSEDVLDRDDLIVFMSYANYRKYVTALRTSNYFHYTPEEAGKEFVTFHPATNIMVAPARGLNGSNQLTLGPAGYMVIGTDLMSDADNLRIFYSQDNDEVRVRANFKVGAQIAYPSAFVTNGIA
jgi:hypothetical protein